MANSNAVGLRIRRMHGAIQAGGRPVEREGESREPGYLHRRLRMMVLDPRADGHVLSGKGVVELADQIVLPLADDRVGGRQDIKGLGLKAAGSHRAIGGAPGKP